MLHIPSLEGLAFLIQSVRWRTKSKKKSPSGTEMTLSAIFTKRLNPSQDLRLSLWAIFAQKSLALVDESTSNACQKYQQYLSGVICIYCPRVLTTSTSSRYCQPLNITWFELSGHLQASIKVTWPALCWINTSEIWYLRHLNRKNWPLLY